ncbi:hypothetical protein BH10BAC4_BH10BAC4_08160 [soil metagenome]
MGSTEEKPKLASAIITAGLIAGTLDILSAFTLVFTRTGKNPIIVLNYISSAIFGKQTAYSGGALMSAIGLLMHYMIAFGWAILFFLLFPKFRLLRFNKIVVGLFYGIFVWTMMNLVLVPMTLIPPSPFNVTNAVTNVIILMVAIGLPISILASRYFSRL